MFSWFYHSLFLEPRISSIKCLFVLQFTHFYSFVLRFSGFQLHWNKVFLFKILWFESLLSYIEARFFDFKIWIIFLLDFSIFFNSKHIRIIMTNRGYFNFFLWESSTLGFWFKLESLFDFLASSYFCIVFVRTWTNFFYFNFLTFESFGRCTKVSSVSFSKFLLNLIPKSILWIIFTWTWVIHHFLMLKTHFWSMKWNMFSWIINSFIKVGSRLIFTRTDII